MKRAKFQLFQREDGQYGIRLRGKNSRIILASEGYKHRQSAVKAIRAVINAVLNGYDVEDLT